MAMGVKAAGSEAELSTTDKGSTPAYLIAFDGETHEILVWANVLERSNDAALESRVGMAD